MEHITVDKYVLLTSKEFTESKKYWLKQLENLSYSREPLLFNSVHKRSTETFVCQLDKPASEKLLALCRNSDLSVLISMITAYTILIHKYTGVKHIAVAIPVSKDEAQEPLNNYNELLPVVCEVNPASSFRELLSAVSENVLNAARHQHYPLNNVYAELGIDENIFDAAFSAPAIHQPVRKDLPFAAAISINEKDVCMKLTAFAGGLSLEDFFVHFHRVISFCIANVNKPVSELSLFTEADERRLLATFNPSANPVLNRSIVDLFKQQVQQTPDATALVFEEKTLSYKELDQSSTELAQHLYAKGVQKETLVPICIDRSIEMIVAIMGVLKAGAAYVPIDPSYPTERINYILDDTGAGIILTASIYQYLLNATGRTCICMDETLPVYNAPLKENIEAGQLAYVIYTSGSTGRPKGVLIEHRSVVNLVQSRTKALSIGRDEKILQFYNYSFDASVEQIFLALLNGAALVILPEGIRLDKNLFERFLEAQQITHLDATPGFLAAITPGKYGSLKRVISGGERCSMALATQWMEHVNFYNAYGPTEATITATTYHCSPAYTEVADIVPIGKPIDSARVYVLNHDKKPVPAGITGELYIGGVQVARGYLNRTELNGEKFLPDPFIPGGRMYRTGDIGRWLSNGNVEYLGRADEQVKIRGYRIELGEVETVLNSAPGVDQGVVLALEEGFGNKRLAAYVVSRTGFVREAIADYMRDRLPEYMVPGIIVEIAELPLTSNGKVDRKKLLSIDVAESNNNIYEAPRNTTEQALASIWQELLELDRVSIHDNFFDIGGHSLLAMRMVSMIRRKLDREIPIREVFINPTIALLSEMILSDSDEQLLPLIERYERGSKIPLSFSQERLWFIDKLQGSLQYHMPYAFRLKGKVNVQALEASFREIVQRHEVLRTVIREEDGLGYQVIMPAEDWQMNQVAAENILAAYGSLSGYVEELVIAPYDLSTDPMLKVWLIRITQEEYLLVTLLHHIAFDGWSIGIMVDELVELYRSHVESKTPNLPVLPVQYADYAIWQRNYLAGELLNKKLAYWKQQLSGVAPLELPSDHVRPTEGSVRGGGATRWMDQLLRDELSTLCQQEGVTLYMLMLSAFNVLLHRYSGQSDICVGSPAAGRAEQEVENLIGFFINTLALRSKVDNSMSFVELLQQVKQTTLQAYDHQDVPFEKIVEVLELERDRSRNAVFQVWLVLQNVPQGGTLDLKDLQLTREPSGALTSQFDLNLNVTETTSGLELTMVYCKDLFEEDTIEQMLEHFENLLRAVVANKEARIGYLRMLSNREEELVLDIFNDRQNDYSQNETLVTLFEQKAIQNPDATAIAFEDKKLSYEELDRRSTQLAYYLMSKGVIVGSLVPICFDRSIDMIVGILAVLKSGAAYVPVDPSYPISRLQFILEDTGCNTVLTTSFYSQVLGNENDTRTIICVDELDAILCVMPTASTEVCTSPESLAYVIYTSGSTGTPKGVLIEHRSVVSLIAAQTKTFGIDEDERILQFSNYSFDASVEQIFLALLNGACLVLINEEQRLEGLEQVLTKHQVTHLHATPSLLEHIREGNYGGLRRVIAGGEVCKKELAQRWVDLVDFYNEYGPTETTVTALEQHCSETNLQNADTIAIGKPLAGVRAYILDACMNVVPLGVMGELYLSGVQVARGYLNREELTKEKFLDDPFCPGERMYRTGDICRWKADGTVEYLGRSDEQVKIRGYRIELGEVESVLKQAAGVKGAVVIAREDKGSKRLVGYIVVDEQLYNSAAVMGFAKEMLPEYMVPAMLVEIDEVPLTSNGKVDRKKLEQKELTIVGAGQFEAPQNETQELLAQIWSELLEVDRISIHDNFFELGGDSIITIQVVSRARRLGLDFQVADIFTYQTIAKLSEAIAEKQPDGSNTAEQGVLTGSSGLLPIQQWYFENPPAAVSHFNQSVLLSINKDLETSALNTVFRKLVQHHDALRFKYNREGKEWSQEYSPAEVSVLTCDCATLESAAFPAALKEYGNQYQASLDIEKGELIRVVLFQTPAAIQQNRLLIIVHHLAVDGVSWRILLEDLQLLISAVKNKEAVNLGAKTSSYRDWYNGLLEYSADGRLLSQEKYWNEIASVYRPLPLDYEYNKDIKVMDMRNCSARLGVELTQKLLQEVPRVYHTEINDLLLCALAMTLSRWSAYPKVVVGLEGHGREESLVQGMNLSQTVGWFTNMYPVLLDISQARGTKETIMCVKEQLRLVPDKGIGYGVLKYINRKQTMQGKQPWDIVFNYLGQWDNVVKQDRWFTIATEPAGAEMNEDVVIGERMLVDSMIQGGELVVNWSYSFKQYDRETIEELTQSFIRNLETMIDHCMEQGSYALFFTPSDYGLAGQIGYKELNQFLKEPVTGAPRGSLIKGLYRLSALQEGLLFHGLYDGGTAYAEQLSCEFEGLDLTAFNKAWQHILERHTILRSSFHYNNFPIAVQCVYKKVNLPLEVVDFSSMHKEEQRQAIIKFREDDQQRGLDFRSAPLMRISLIKLSEERYSMLWTYHHLIFDGWSMPVLMQEFLQTYDYLLKEEELPAFQEDRYEDYIRYIENKSKEKQEQFWKEYLKNIEEPTLLPFVKQRSKAVSDYKEEVLELPEQYTTALNNYARKHHLTTNTIMQGAWSYLLHRYTANTNVVYGVTVSGRPEDLAGVEARVGIYTNTLALCSTISEEEKVSEWLSKIQQGQLEAREYQYTSLSQVQQLSPVGGELFDTMMTFQNYPVTEVVKEQRWQLKVKDVEVHEQTTNFPLSLRITISKTIQAQFIYKNKEISREDVQRIRGHFAEVLRQMINEDISVKEIELLTAEEKQKLHSFNTSAPEYLNDYTVVDLFAQCAANLPHQAAVVFAGQQLTYAELDARSTALASYLIGKGVKAETLVPICMDRSIEMIVSILAVLKAGGAYIPIDPAYPQKRIQYILEDIDAGFVLTTSSSASVVPDHITQIAVDEQWHEIRSASKEFTISIDAKQLAYVIYTSGTTGKPKGVLVEHAGVVNMVLNHINLLDLRAGYRILQFASFSFDGSCQEIFNTLCSGGALIMVTREEIMSAEKMGAVLKDQQVDIATLPPSYQHVIKDHIDGLKMLYSAGEPLNAEIGRYIQSRGIRLINGYGPTENSVTITLTDQPILEDGTVTIGRPIKNVDVYIVDERGQLVPQGVAGEIWVGGQQVARGYLKRPELTNERFANNPFGSGRIYKTGDRGRWLTDGTIEYVGRKDDQVKIRGYRVELGEVEAALQMASGVLQAVVVATEDNKGANSLIGFVVCDENDIYDREVVIAYLESRLPEYMVPRVLVEVKEIPLTVNGKADKKRLLQLSEQEQPEEKIVEQPVGQLEETLASIWKELLEVEVIDRKDDFFALGGHSLLAIRLISAIKKEFNKEFSIKDVFDHPTFVGLAELLQQTNDNDAIISITRSERDELIPLSFSQEQLWFVDRLKGTVEYHMPYVFRLKGALNVEALELAFRNLINRHESLRTVIVEKDGRGYQEIRSIDQWKWQYSQVQEVITKNNSLQQYIEDVCAAPFDLSKDDVLRVVLLKENEEEHLLIAVIHHIAFDGWSMSVMVEELAELYRSQVQGVESNLKELPVQYADYAIWQRKHFSEDQMSAKLNYWKQQLKGLEPLKLLTDYPRPSELSIKGGSVNRTLNKELLTQLQQLCQDEGVTMFMMMLGAFKILLHRYSAQTDICIGCPIAGRQQKEIEGLIGFFVNTLVLRSEVEGEISFRNFLQKIKRTTLEAYDHQQVPFEQVVKSLGLERDISRHPVFDVRFQLQNAPEAGSLDLGGVQLSAQSPGDITALSDLGIDIKESENVLSIRLVYCSDLYKQDTAERMLEHYEHLLRAIVSTPETAISKLQLIGEKEEQLLLNIFGTSSVNYPKRETVVSLFRQQALKTPDATAVVFENEQLSYVELDERTNQLAHYLRNKGVKNEELVAISVKRSLECVVGILGILKAGAAYVPIDAQYPDDRLAYIFEDTGAKICLGDSGLRQRIQNVGPERNIEFIDLKEDAVLINAAPSGRINYSDPQQIVYIIYTSGSTGMPKGVMIEHSHLVDHVYGMFKSADLKQCSSFALFASLVADAGHSILFSALLSGGTVHVLSDDLLLDGGSVVSYLRDHEIDCIKIVPSLWLYYLDGNFKPLPRKILIFGGEAFALNILDVLKQENYQGVVYNHYGPTEATIGKCIHKIELDRNYFNMPIGKPFSNSRAYIVDANKQLCPIGIAGELLLGGDGVARGYLKRPELTTEKFVDDPFGKGKVYKTGDICRWLSDGNIEYLGRRDDQVKIRGYRIELGEIETALSQLPEVVANCVVVKKDVAAATNRLVSYYVPAQDVLKEKERELHLKQVSSWKELYESENARKEDDPGADSEFNILGWDDSFTGNPIPAEEMRLWLNDITNVIMTDNPQRVLEIGCGKGLIFYQLAGRVQKYIGTDFSNASVNQIKEVLKKAARDYGETAFQVCAAHEVSLNAQEQIDTIVLNSIVQYFPGEDYLTTVVRNGIQMLKGNGRIIIGDVRDFRLLHHFKSRLSLEKLQEGLSLKEFLWHVDQEVLKEEELCYSPEYFYALQSVFPEITHIDIQWKNDSYVNELSLYRFTAVIYVGVEKERLQPVWQQWDSINDKQSILRLLEEGAVTIALKDVPNPRLWKERKLEECIDNKTVNNVRELSAAISAPVTDHAEVFEIISLAEALGYDYRSFVDEDPMKMNLLIGKCLDGVFVSPEYSERTIAPGGIVTNMPLFMDIAALLHNQIRQGLLKRLPDYMVPADFIALQHLPLTINGKADRNFLSSREDLQITGTANYQPPVTELEQKLAAIWQELLRVKKVGLYDNFFNLGGHSLLATRVVAAIRKELNIELSIKDLFVHTTIQTLAAHVQNQESADEQLHIGIQPKSDRIPLSFSQERLWFIDKLQGSVQYHLPWVFKLQGQLNTEHLESSFRQIVQRHQVLRTVIREEEGTSYQHILPAEGWKLQFISKEAIKVQPISLKEFAKKLIATPFDLSNDFMLKVWLIECAKDEYMLVAVVHHIASDGWSTGILVEELVELYRSKTEQRQAVLKELPIQYADYSIWQRNQLNGDLLNNKLDYWKQELADLAPLELPTDYARPAEQSTRAAVVNKTIDKELLHAVQKFGMEEGVTTFMTLLSVFNLVLQRYSGQSDICVGSPIAGRQYSEVEGLIGFFINTLALRSNVNAAMSFRELVQQVKQTTLDAYEHQEVPFEKIVDALGVERDMSRTPLFQVVFMLQNMPESTQLDLGPIKLTRENSGHIASQFDFGLDIAESANGLQLSLTYCSDLYIAATMQRLLDHFENLLKNALAHKNKSISSLSMLGAQEQHQLLYSFNNTATDYPNDKTVVALFDEQVKRSPDAIALVFEDVCLTYSELQRQSNKLAHYLRSKGVKEETLVPLCMNRSSDLIVSILGILKAGGAYVPVDPSYPASRIAYMLRDTGSTLLLTHSAVQLAEELTGLTERINIDERAFAKCSSRKPALKSNASSLAYVLYTSGSTGTPKGVQVEHRNIVSLVKGVSFVDLSASEVILSTGSPSFDASTIEYWGALLNGGKLVMCSQDTLLNVARLKELILGQQVTTMWFTAGWFNELVETDSSLFSTLKTILVGGDRLSPAHIAQIRTAYPELNIVNGYGPTENTTFSLTYPITKVETGKDIPIGYPLSNRRAYILDEQYNLCPIGITGEVCVGGDGLSRGYLNQPLLNEEKFIDDPFVKGERLYKTGDLGKWNPDGSIEYLGRKDEQVKIRGYRIELGEIENALQQIPAIQQAAVVAVQDGESTNKKLIAYILSEEKTDTSFILSQLQNKLPDYMIPAAIMQISSMPLTANGKVDRRKLQAMEIVSANAREYTAPRNEMEEQMAALWKQLLKLDHISIHDNFFELGGHSLLAMRLTAAIRKEMNVEINVKTFFQLPTIELISRYVKVNQGNTMNEPEEFETIKL